MATTYSFGGSAAKNASTGQESATNGSITADVDDGAIQVGDLITTSAFSSAVMEVAGLPVAATNAGGFPISWRAYYLGTYTLGGETAFIFGADPVLANNTGLFVLYDGDPPPGAFLDLVILFNDRATATLGTANACFAAGTRIATPFGERTVETLGIGDAVLTADGSARTVKWIGRRGYSRNALALSRDLRPVVVRAGALADGVPRRELRVSGQHGLWVEGDDGDFALVPAAALVNGFSVVWGEAAAVRYFHIELEDHALVVADGAVTETFVDADSRGMFENAAEFAALYPDAGAAVPALPRVEGGWRVEAARRRIAARAGRVDAAVAPPGPLRGQVERVVDGVVEGWAMDPADPERSVELVLRGSGGEVRVVANQYRTDLLVAGVGSGRHGFRAVLPEGVAPEAVVRAADGAVLAWPSAA